MYIAVCDDQIEELEKLSPAGVITFSGHNVPVSRLLYGQLQKDYLALLFSGRDA